jgi:endonuclease/exonuclease/phosphatase family metal-dependent hydrolase
VPAAIAVGFVLFLDAFRTWLPSILFVYGRAGSTPATEMGLFALLPFALAFAGVLAVRVAGASRVAAVAAVALAALRLALQATAGGDAQLWIATGAVTAGLVWLVATAAAAPAAAAAIGVVGGLAGDAALHTVLRSTGLGWRPGALPWLAVAAACAAFLALSVLAARDRSVAPAGRGWRLVGPVLVLHGIVAAMPARLHTISGWPEWTAALLVLGGHAAAVAAAVAVVSGAPRRLRALGAVLTIAGLAAALAEPVALVALGHAVLPVGLGVAVVATLGRPGGTAGSVRPALGAAGGMLVFLALAFGYYATYDIAVPVAAEVMLAVAGVAVAVVAGRAAAAPPGAEAPTAARTALARPVAAALLGGVLLGTGAVAAVAREPAPVEGDGFPVRIMLYNLQMGFDVDGRQSVDRQADVAAHQGPDILALNEVSRGWLTNASTDTLPRLAQRVGLPWIFAPGADRVWGNALLTRFGVDDVRIQPLPQGGAAMRRSLVSAVVDLGGGHRLGIVVTHLHHVAEGGDVRAAQVEQVAAEARRLADAGLPVVVIGDLNAEPADPELAPLTSWLVDASAGLDVATWPSWDPVQHIDHIFVTPDLVAQDFAVTASTASDHQGVAVTLDRAP